MFRPVRITPPAQPLIQIEDAKVFLRVDGAEDDVLIQGLIAAAVDHLDGRTGILGRCLVTQVWRYQTSHLPRCFDFDMPGATAATVTYHDGEGSAQSLPESDYTLVETARGSRLVASRDHGSVRVQGPVTIDATFGTSIENVPPALVQAIRMLIAHWYAHREAVITGPAAPLPMGVDMLIAPYRWMSV